MNWNRKFTLPTNLNIKKNILPSINDSQSVSIQEEGFKADQDEDLIYQKVDVELFMDIKKAKNQIRLQIQKERITELIKKVNTLIQNRQNDMREKIVLQRRKCNTNDEIMNFFNNF